MSDKYYMPPRQKWDTARDIVILACLVVAFVMWALLLVYGTYWVFSAIRWVWEL